MEKVKCEQCGAEIPKKNTVLVFNRKIKEGERICMTCYYKKVTEWQGMIKGIEEMRKEGIQ